MPGGLMLMAGCAAAGAGGGGGPPPFGNWSPVLSAGISDDGSRNFTTAGGDSWARAGHSDIAYGDIDLTTGLSTNDNAILALHDSAILTDPYTARFQWNFSSTHGASSIDGVAGPSTGYLGALPAGTLLGLRRGGGLLEFGYYDAGDPMTWIDFPAGSGSFADPSSGAPLYITVGSYRGGATFGPVLRLV